MLENALGSLRHKMHGVHTNPAEVERYRRQQRLLERELSRVRSILAHNSKVGTYFVVGPSDSVPKYRYYFRLYQ